MARSGGFWLAVLLWVVIALVAWGRFGPHTGAEKGGGYACIFVDTGTDEARRRLCAVGSARSYPYADPDVRVVGTYADGSCIDP